MQDLFALARTITRKGNKNKRLTAQQLGELLRTLEVGMIGLAVYATLSDQEDESLLGNIKNRIVQETMSRLREKLGDDPQSPRYIQTVSGVGYRIIARS